MGLSQFLSPCGRGGSAAGAEGEGAYLRTQGARIRPARRLRAQTKNSSSDRTILPISTRMVDNLSPEERSRLMSRIRGKDTKPEMVVRRLVHRLGYRFRLHRRDLPGSPDLVFPGKRKVIFVHGCYWHRHDCKKATTPKSNVEFWQKKFDDNITRDVKNVESLTDLGWETLIVWQCEAEEHTGLADRLITFLERASS